MRALRACPPLRKDHISGHRSMSRNDSRVLPAARVRLISKLFLLDNGPSHFIIKEVS